MSKPEKPYLRKATDNDFWRFYGRRAPACWAGIVADDGRMLLGIGGVVRSDDGRWWCHFEKAPGVSGLRAAKLMQKAARTLLGALDNFSIGEVYAIADPRISGAEFWLSRLGFAPSEERKGGLAVWRWKR